MAEIEHSVLKGQCLDRRIADMSTMPAAVLAWETDRYNRTKKTDWQFTTTDARIKLKRLYTPHIYPPRRYPLHLRLHNYERRWDQSNGYRNHFHTPYCIYA